MIKVQNFSKKYSSKADYAVKDISFTVQTGQIMALIGPNGAGKTTIIKALCGFHYPTEGSIIVEADGKTYDLSKVPQDAMNLIGYVPEKSILPLELTVEKFLHYTAELHALKADEIQKKIEEVIAYCSLEKVKDKKIKTLSKGYQQRVSFAQAIIYEPPILVLDEPISGLDPLQIIQMRKLIKELSKNKVIIMSTHILQEVYELCDFICILNNGTIAINGSEKEILQKTGYKNLEEAFLKLAGVQDE